MRLAAQRQVQVSKSRVVPGGVRQVEVSPLSLACFVGKNRVASSQQQNLQEFLLMMFF